MFRITVSGITVSGVTMVGIGVSGDIDVVNYPDSFKAKATIVMTEWLFDIFGDRLTKESTRNLPRQPLSNNENFGKLIAAGPVKPNEPLKKAGDTKKSFLSNTGKALRDISTPIPKPLSPRSKNLENSARKVLCSQLIYNEENENQDDFEELQFTRPTYRLDNYHTDSVDYLFDPEPRVLLPSSPRTPSPVKDENRSLEFEDSYDDEFFTDDFAKDIDVSPFGEDDFGAFYPDSD